MDYRDAVREGLRRHEMFQALTTDLLERVVALGSVEELTAGAALFHKGDPGDALFYVLDGVIEIGVEAAPGNFRVMNRMERETLFGEIALLDGLPRTADALAAVRSELFRIARTDFLGLMAEEPRLTEAVIRTLCERVRWTSELVEARQRAELALRKLTSAVEHSPSMVLITDAEGVIEYVNPKFAAITGYGSDEAIGATPRILKSGTTPPGVYESMWSALRAGEEWRGELQNRVKGGDLYWEALSIAPVRDHTGNITHFVAVGEDVTERKRLQEELRRLATTDSLTGLANRRYFMEQSNQLAARAQRGGHALSVLMLDIDFFKKVNDTYGHATGDDTLKAFAACASAQLREVDLLGRLGGEEFAVVLPDTALAEAMVAAERLRSALAEVVVPTALGPLRFTVSIGAAEVGGQGIEGALHAADAALYRAKQGGRNRAVAA